MLLTRIEYNRIEKNRMISTEQNRIEQNKKIEKNRMISTRKEQK